MSRLLVVSNRLPFTMTGGSATPASGGLVAALRPILDKRDSLWIGYGGDDVPDSARIQLEEQGLVSVDVDPRDYSAFYNGYANSSLWPLFHYFTERCRFKQLEFESYRRVNQVFADRIVEIARPDDLIWIHDYQLMLVPQLIRKHLPTARIGFFLHIPFPSPETFRVLPQRVELLRGLLGADMIGLHTYEYTENLQRSFRRLLGIESFQGRLSHGGREVRLETHPISIDVADMRKAAFSPAADRFMAEISRHIGERRVVLGVDRLDYSKGIPLRLKAWENFLENCPEWRSNAVLIQVAVPSRESISSYADQKREVEQLVGAINGRFGSPGSVPIHYMYQSVSRAELGALYRVAGATLVTPLRDGMNLVAKEFVACRDDGDAVLLLSEFAGAASELGEAVRINPWDIEGTALQIQRSLEMDELERRQRMQAMYRRVVENDVHAWATGFIESAEGRVQGDSRVPPQLPSRVLVPTVVQGFENAKNAVLILDYDGTLREFTDRYEEAEPTDEIRNLLVHLDKSVDAHLFLSLGRDRETAEQWFSGLPLGLIAENGAWVRESLAHDWRRVGHPPDDSWKVSARAVMHEYASRLPGARVEERESALVWHYRQADVATGRWQALELAGVLEDLLSSSPAVVSFGSNTVEARHQNVSLVAAFDNLETSAGSFDFVLATGDGRHEEELFERLPEKALTIKVGSGPSHARVSVSSPGALRAMLRALCDSLDGDNQALEHVPEVQTVVR